VAKTRGHSDRANQHCDLAPALIVAPRRIKLEENLAAANATRVEIHQINEGTPIWLSCKLCRVAENPGPKEIEHRSDQSGTCPWRMPRSGETGKSCHLIFSVLSGASLLIYASSAASKRMILGR